MTVLNECAAKIDAEITRMEADLERLRCAREALRESEAATTLTAVVAAEMNGHAGSGEAKRGRPNFQPVRRRQIAGLLTLVGPLGTNEIGRRLGIPIGSLNGLLTHPWFRKDGDDNRSPYTLTDEGRRAATRERATVTA